MRLIDADALMKDIEAKSRGILVGGISGMQIREGISLAEVAVMDAPTIDAQPVVHGRWCKDGDWLVCLNCESEINIKNSLGIENRKNYCPNCGANMKEGEQDGC